MRTTLTLDPDVAQMLADEAHRARRPMKQVVNDAIRRGLSRRSGSDVKRYRVTPHVTTLAAGIDAGRFNTLADELEDEAVVARLGQRR